jgi:predicted component of type VI protein secretion system
MDERRFHKLLSDLHAELLAAKPVEPQDRELLQLIAGDIRALLDAAPASAAQQYGPLRSRLRDGVTRFETSHPEFVQKLAKVIDAMAFYNL